MCFLTQFCGRASRIETQSEDRTVLAECCNGTGRHTIHPRCQEPPGGKVEMMNDELGEQPS